ncbi:MAG: signal peptidase II [Candidatus Krumholzibacteria bacterium]|nr:signal peptidase II [Candidatus Krumholzibacteria bacterium]
MGSFRWPTYNVADIAVTVGAALLIFGFIRHPRHE